MTISRLSFAILFSIFLLSLTHAQSWTIKGDMATQTAFDEKVSEFETYWTNKPYERSHGFKPFRRWEYKWSPRRLEDGSFPTAGQNLQAYQEFEKQYSSETRSTEPWTSLGPNSNQSGYYGTGRVNSVGFHPTNTNVIYCGSAGGGLWKTTNGGTSWTPKTDFLGSIGVSAVVVDHNNANTIYIATGDGDAADNYSIGVLMSTNGGDTWQTTGLDWQTSATRLIRAMVQDPDNSNTLIAATSVGIYRTTNGGTTWNLEQSGNFYDVDFNPDSNSNTFYATTSGNVYRSTNNGDTWSSVYSISGSNRLAIATTADNEDYVYVLASKSGDSSYKGVYRSTNAGTSFTLMSSTPNILGYSPTGATSGGQGWYDLVIAADPTDADVIHIGGVNHWRSDDGGATWTVKSTWTNYGVAQEVHADKHMLEWQDNSTLWEGNDGGIYKTVDGGDVWTDHTGDMVISQMYRIGVSETDTKIVAGLQDNGSKLRSNNGVWTDEVGGDGMDCAINPLNSSVMYACIQYGELRRSTNGGTSWTDIQNNIPGAPSGGWVTPYVLDPAAPSTIYAGYNDLYKSTNQGGTWTTLGDFSGGKLESIAISPSNSSYIYAQINGTLHRTTDGGVSWISLNTMGSSTSMVKVSPTNPETIYAVRQGYSNGNKVFKSTNGGATWTNISGNLPNIPANCIAIHDDGEETIYVGMDVGVYYKNNSITEWTAFNTDLPNVQVSEIEIKEQSDEIYLATYGRGVWKNTTIGESSLCVFPDQVMLDSITSTYAELSWSAPSVAPADGYEYAIRTTQDIPTTYTSTSSLAVTVDTLQSGTAYYLFLRSVCDEGFNSSWVIYGPFVTKFQCGDTVYDSGGVDVGYSSNEDYQVTVCADQGSDITFTFTEFDIECCNWDAVYVHDGPDISAPIFSSGNSATQAGFPAGGYWGSTIPGPFTSTGADGCLTVRLLSDENVEGDGFTIETSCTEPSCSTVVTTLADAGAGSLRSAVACAQAPITLDPSVIGGVIFLQSPLVVESEVELMLPNQQSIVVTTLNTHKLWQVNGGAELKLNNITMQGASSTNQPLVTNQGVLILHNVNILSSTMSTFAGEVVENTGTLEIIGDTTIK